jgi:DNA-binding HxlR family transcriptional regulator
VREFEQDGVIVRHASGGQPQRVDYSLSPPGCELIPVREGMCAWGQKNLGVEPTLPPLVLARA